MTPDEGHKQLVQEREERCKLINLKYPDREEQRKERIKILKAEKLKLTQFKQLKYK